MINLSKKEVDTLLHIVSIHYNVGKFDDKNSDGYGLYCKLFELKEELNK